MTNSTYKTKRVISAMLAGVFLMGLVSLGLFGIQTQAFAQDTETVTAAAETVIGASEGACVKPSPGVGVCPQTGAKNAIKTVGEKILSPVFRIALITALLNLAQFVLDRIAYEAAVAIASGGSGQESMFYKTEPSEAFANLGLEIAGEAVGSLSELGSDELGLNFNLCDPGAQKPALDFALSIGIKQKYSPEEPKCDILEVGANWEGFIGDALTSVTDPEARQEAILGKFAESLKPGKNELGASLRINIAVDQKVKEQKLTQFLQRNESDYKNVTDFISGNVKTPSDTLQKDFEKSLEDVDGDQGQINVGELVNAKELIGGLALTTASTFANTLLSQLMNKIYTGLFDDNDDEFDPFNIEGLAGSGRESAQARFAEILSTNPIQTTEYNALSEFVVCPPEGVANRGLSNCVMDSNFLAAVVRGNSGSPLTVQEAIDDGFISGDWVLIGPDQLASNQDPNCYNYGFCYGNLVKLRKARVIPIGWELAAFRNTGGSSLQDIVDGFDNCSQSGEIGPSGTSTQWCHLIDPNWVLKYPDAQCRALVNGEIRISGQTNGRLTYCADAPSCIGEDNDGNCSDGYGYCVEEKNTWRFRGDECPQEFASCLSFDNTESGEKVDFLVNTVDYSVCGQDNAGCRWYRTQKYFDDLGTENNESDDAYVWMATGDDYIVADRNDDWAYRDATTTVAATRGSYSYSSGTSLTNTYDTFAYEDRIYLTHDGVECSDEDGGCTQLYEFDDDLVLNSIVNPSLDDDDDSDGFPDNWNDLSSSTSQELTTSEANYGSYSFLTSSSTFQQFVHVEGNDFYTLSFYAQADSVAALNTTVTANLFDEDGVAVSVGGTSYAGDCTQGIGSYEIDLDPSNTTQLPAGEWSRFECTFTTTDDTDLVEVLVVSPNMYLDAFQLELGEDANGFTEGYNFTTQLAYYKVSPDYLGCTGADSDPAGCGDYAQACSAQEVGCSLYTPDDGDPSVPAIVSALDECPSSCVGYTTYKQEATDRESESFPLYFIATSAATCSEQSVGCDAFTSLASAAEGGEGTEYFTDTRSCLTEAIADGSARDKQPATFFTWEGSDNAGYQLKTWYLLSSNYTGAITQFNPVTGSGFSEPNPEGAPCTHISMTSENVIVCDDNAANSLGNPVMTDDVWNNNECDEHDDIFDNPDCREYFDPQGEPHYRLHSMTVSVDEACTPYRMDDSNQTDCQASGGFWAAQGFCRYYVLATESDQCSESQSGCREYTGGSGRNATTILNEIFEAGTYEDFVFIGPTVNETLGISNESVATDGHSLSVTNTSGTNPGFETIQIYLNAANTDATYDVDASTTCTSVGGTVSGAGCDVETDVDSDGTADMSCTIADGQESCGTLTDSLVGGKTFVLDFWAKGSGDLYVAFVEEGGTGLSHDMVDAVDATTTTLSIDLSGAWQLYSLGPLDTGTFDDFDENAIVQFYTDAGDLFYVDNLSLKQAEENVTVIKDSWVVPSVCDQTPAGADSDQYYLGCESYSDHNGNDADLYQFTNICNEEVVGCEGFFNTHNSDSEFTEVYNARCVYTNDALDDLTDGDTASANTDCVLGGETLCTIIVGTSYCTFNAEKTFETPLPVEGNFGIVYGPETRFVRADGPTYMVVNDSVACEPSAMGCTEFGEPTYNQTQTEVTEFESTYFIDLPANYDDILCDQQALFCEEWTSTESGNFYFKHPLEKFCEYKKGVPLGNQSYLGWFRSGTTEPCYWTDDDGDGEFDIGEDSSIIEGGDTFKVWRNGDTGYDGWVAQCEPAYDLCTEFVDVVDTSAAYSYGQSYYFTNDELLEDEAVRETQRCEGRVSQKQGCALFYNTTNSDLSYSASASYVTSIHADVIFGENPNDLVDPVTCDVEGSAVFELSDADAEFYGVEDGLTTSSLDDNTVDLCMRRCGYVVDTGDYIETSTSEEFATSFGNDSYLERSCLGNTDCPILTTNEGDEVSGTCTNVWEVIETLGVTAITPTGGYTYDNSSAYKLSNDTNEVLKVDRDRSCSAWLACDSSKTSWNSSTNQYDRICDSIDLCIDGRLQGDEALCTNWQARDVEILTTQDYSARDVTWNGFEYSGNTIPNQLPIEAFNQFNVQAVSSCQDETGEQILNADYLPAACNSFTDCGVDLASTSCTTDLSCTGAGYGGCDCEDDGSGGCDLAVSSGKCFYTCENNSDTDYRLVYKAGECDSTEPIDDDGDGVADRGGVGNGGSCRVGSCGGDGVSCNDDDDCGAEECVVGYCQAQAQTCPESADCSCNPDSYLADGITHADCENAVAGSVSTPICDSRQYVCVDVLTSDEDNRDACVDTVDCGSQQICVPASTSTVGSCFNNQCLTDITDRDGNGLADPLYLGAARVGSCRGFPEFDSPFPTSVVSEWKIFEDPAIGDDGDSPTSLNFEPQQGVAGLTQASVPYSYLGGFQDSTVCALDNDGVPVDCSCSYDKVEFGNGSAYQYFPSRTSFPVDSDAEVPLGVCSSGSFIGIACETDDDCAIDGDDIGTCDPLTQISTMYGWYGYCIERDTSIQTLGSQADEDQACLSWLPIDQLAGATDLYAKFTSAGYSPQDTYYCAEIDLTFNVGTTQIACAEVQDNLCNQDSFSDFKWESYNHVAGSGEDDCVAAAWCPEGFFGVMSPCGDLTYNDMCYGGDDDCPFYCVPKLSYKTAQNESTGAPCLPPTQVDGWSGWDWSSDPDNSDPFYYSSGNVDDHWMHYYDNGDLYSSTRFYVLPPDKFETAYAYYNDCMARGVLAAGPGSNFNEFIYPAQDIDDLPHDLDHNDGIGDIFSGKGIRDLAYSYLPVASCKSLVQVSTTSLAEDDALPFDTYNAAYTDRLWQTGEDRYTISDSDPNFRYTNLTGQAQFGKATDYQILADLADPYPHEVVMCSNGVTTETAPVDPANACADTSLSVTSSSGDDARAYWDTSIGLSGFGNVPFCKDANCSCLDNGVRNNEWCAWNTSANALIECGGATHTGECDTSVDEDGDPLVCDLDNKTCVSDTGVCTYDDCDSGDTCNASCDGGTYNGNACDNNNDCSSNYCFGVANFETGTYISATCRENASANLPIWSVTGNGTPSTTISRLSQIFGRFYGFVVFTDDGYDGVSELEPGEYAAAFADPDRETWTYYTEDNADPTWIWDNRYDTDGEAPHIAAIGSCTGSECEEGPEDKFTIEESTSGTIEAVASYRASVSFFAYADTNQMPIRRIVVDWGDDFTSLTGDQPWSPGSQSGSNATDNFYKNHRGVNPVSRQSECTDSTEVTDEFGNSSRACSSSYLTYSHDYVCTPGQLSNLSDSGRTCTFEDDGRLVNSPCVESGACVFQPRIHVMDNWGWCTGFCDSESADTGEECFTGKSSSGIQINECDVENCPGGGSGACQEEFNGGGLSNPWINWGGYIAIVPE